MEVLRLHPEWLAFSDVTSFNHRGCVEGLRMSEPWSSVKEMDIFKINDDDVMLMMMNLPNKFHIQFCLYHNGRNSHSTPTNCSHSMQVLKTHH